MSSTDAAKYDDLSKSLSEAFSIFNGGGSSIGDGQMISAGATQLNELDEYFNDESKNTYHQYNAVFGIVRGIPGS